MPCRFNTLRIDKTRMKDKKIKLIISKTKCNSDHTVTLLFCTLISENKGLEKSRSVSDLRKISGPAHLNFFSVCHLNFFQVYGINLAFFSGDKLKKNLRCAGPEIFLRSETDLDF